MAITIKELVEKLKEKDQSTEVEFIVAKTSGELVVVDASKNTAKQMVSILKMIGGSK